MATNLDISNMSLGELKALAYDFIAQREQVEVNLRMVNEEIKKKMAEKPVAENA